MESLNSRQNTIFRFIEEHGSSRCETSSAASTPPRPPSGVTSPLWRSTSSSCAAAVRRMCSRRTSRVFTQREYRNRRAKQRIARLAASLVEENDTIILDAGTTTLEIAKLLVGRSNLTVLTNSLPVANIFAGSRVSLLLAGGHLFSQNMSTQGPDAEAFFKKVEVNKSFIGASGVRASIGLETLNPYEAEIKHLMVQSAKQVYAVIDGSKFDTAGINVFCTFGELDYIITDEAITDEAIVQKLREENVQVLTPDVR